MTQLWTFFNTYAAGIQAIGVFIAFGWVAYQTRQTNRQTLLTSLTALSDYNREINVAMLQDPRLAALAGFESQDVLAFILLNSYQLRYLLKERRLVDTRLWETTEEAINYAATLDFIQHFWWDRGPQKKGFRELFSQGFRQYFDPKVSMPAPIPHE